MKIMIKCLTGAFVLGSANIAMAMCPADCESKKCDTKTAKTEECEDSKCEDSKCKDSKCEDSKCKDSKCKDSKCKDSKCDPKVAAVNGLEQVSYKVSGMTCDGCSGAITKNLEKIEGVSVKKVCHESGCAVVNYDPKKVKKEEIIAAINQGEFKITAERITVPVKGMTCGDCSEKVTVALKELDGVTVKCVCHKSGKAVVDIDASKCDRAAVVKAITATGFSAE